MKAKIGTVSRMVSLSIKRIREYEKEGLIKPIRKASKHRLYDSFEIRQIKQISHLIHSRGFTLAGIKQLLNMAPCWKVFDCRNTAECPAYQYPHERCWQVRERLQQDLPCGGTCERCALFLVREDKTVPLFEKTPHFG